MKLDSIPRELILQLNKLSYGLKWNFYFKELQYCAGVGICALTMPCFSANSCQRIQLIKLIVGAG